MISDVMNGQGDELDQSELDGCLSQYHWRGFTMCWKEYMYLQKSTEQWCTALSEDEGTLLSKGSSRPYVWRPSGVTDHAY